MRMLGQASSARGPGLLTSLAAAGQGWRAESGTFPRAVGFIGVEGF